MVAAQLAELDRIEDKFTRTTEKKVNFLQRLELNEKEKAEDHSSMMMERKQHWDDIRYRQEIEGKKLVTKRKNLDKKDLRQTSQVKLAQDRSQSMIEMKAEKRKLNEDKNLTNNTAMKNLRFDLNMSKLYRHELKKQQRAEFGSAMIAAANVTKSRAVSEL